jgi:hypothetical protein
MSPKTIEHFLKLLSEAWKLAAATNYSGIQIYEVNWYRGGIHSVSRVESKKTEMK